MREGGFGGPPREESLVQNREASKVPENRKVFSFQNKMLRCFGFAATLFSLHMAEPAQAFGQDVVTQDSHSSESSEKKEKGEILKLEVQKKVREYEETSSSLTPDEIVEYLKVAPFLQKEKLKIVDLDVEVDSQVKKQDVLKETLEKAVQSGLVQSDSEELQIVRIDFNKIAHPPLAAVYLDQYNVLLVPSSQTSVAPVLQNFFGVKYRNEKEERTNTVIGTFDQEVEDFKLKIHSIDDIPESFIEKYGDEFLTVLKTEREFLGLSRGVIKNALPHEGFHYFFDKYFREKASSYSGPTLATVLESALKTKNLRFGKGSAPDYYQVTGDVVDTLYDQFQLDDEQKMKEFCEKLAHSIESHGKEFASESTSQTETQEDRLMEQAEEFINEALARSYAVAVGINREKSIENVQKELSALGGTLSEEEKVAVASPQNVPMLFISEVELFEQMKVNGESIILGEGQKVYDDLK